MVAQQAEPNILMILGDHWLEYEAAIALASFQATQNTSKITFAQPRHTAFWPHPPASKNTAWFRQNGAEVIEFEPRVFGAEYPIGNKIEALLALPQGQPFVFFDTDTVFLRPIDWSRINFSAPMASLKRTDTWPNLTKSTASRHDIWTSVYAELGLDIQDHEIRGAPTNSFERYPYFNAGVITGPCPHALAARWLDAAQRLRASRHPLICAQSLNPWLDQVTLGPIIAAMGGGMSGGTDISGMTYLDHEATCHYRRLSLAYAREPDEVIQRVERAGKDAQAITSTHHAPREFILNGLGKTLRDDLFEIAQNWDEKTLRKHLKSKGYWIR